MNNHNRKSRNFRLRDAEVYNTGVTTHGNKKVPIMEFRFVFDEEQKKKSVDEAVRSKLRQLLKADGPFRTTVSYWADTNYSSDFITIRSEEDIDNLQIDDASMTDYDEVGIFSSNAEFDAVSIFYKAVSARAGGADDKHNDCLYYCLIEAFYKLPKVLKSPAAFKRWLGLSRDDKVSINVIPKIEDELEMCINISGVEDYYSDKTYPKSVNMALYGEHFEVAGRCLVIDDYKALKYGYKEGYGRPYPIFYKKNLKANTVKLCRLDDINKSRKVTTFTKPLSYLSDFYRKHNEGNTNFLVAVKETVKYIDSNGEEKKKLKEPEDVINKRVDEALAMQKDGYEILGKDARGALNPFHSNFQARPMACHYWYKHAPKCISNCDEFMLGEDRWLVNSLKGGLLYAKKCELDKCYEHDFNSFYSSLMLECDFITRAGKWETYNVMPKLDEDKDTYTIWRCKIKGFDRRLFYRSGRPDKKHMYCGSDVITAQEEGYKIEMIIDGRSNCLRYDENTRIPGHEVFEKFVKDMYKLKLQGCFYAKEMINSLWGYLTMKNLIEYRTNRGEVKIADGDLIKRIYPDYYDKKKKKQHYLIQAYDCNASKLQLLKFKYARFGPFLTALGRRKMYKLVKKIGVDNVYRIHTDGVACSKRKVKGVEYGTGLGMLKRKKWKDVKIKNLRDFTVRKKKSMD